MVEVLSRQAKSISEGPSPAIGLGPSFIFGSHASGGFPGAGKVG